MYNWYKIVPNTTRSQSIADFWDEQQEAKDISQEFVMDNDIHYKIVWDIWHMDLNDEERLALTLILPDRFDLCVVVVTKPLDN